MIVVDMEKAFRISLIINIVLFILFGVMTVLFITKKTECPNTNQKYGLKNIVIDEANISFKNDQYTYDVYLEDDTVDKLNIKATPYNNESEIIISGNHGLAGANKKITITVYDINDEAYEYIININKNCIDKNTNDDAQNIDDASGSDNNTSENNS